MVVTRRVFRAISVTMLDSLVVKVKWRLAIEELKTVLN
jgi:hypothetical protein